MKVFFQMSIEYFNILDNSREICHNPDSRSRLEAWDWIIEFPVLTRSPRLKKEILVLVSKHEIEKKEILVLVLKH